MKAVRIDAPGVAERLGVVDIDRPTVAPGEVLVRVAVAGVNFADTMQRRDAYFAPVAFPFVPGVEVGGTVEALGDGVDGFRIGDRIAGVILGGGGGYAQFAALKAVHAAQVPDGLDLERATGVLNQGLTAQGLLETAPEVARGASVLVTAAGGGVGGLLVQLARLGGAATVVAAASDVAKLAAFAASDVAVVSYAADGWAREVRAATSGRGIGVAFDGVGGTLRAALPRLMAARGRIVFYGAASGATGIDDGVLTQILGKCLSLTGYSIYTSIQEDPAWLRKTLGRLFELVARKQLRVPIHPPFDLARAAEAHRAIESRSTVGKILIRVAETPKEA